MLLRTRCRYRTRKLHFFVLLLVLGFLLLMVTMLNPAPKTLNKEELSQGATFFPKDGYQVDFHEPQEILDTQEDSQQYFLMEGLSPFIAFREDELLVAVESITPKRNHTKVRKGYRMVRQQSKRQEEAKQGQDQDLLLQALPLQDEGQTEAFELLAIGGLEMHGFNEAISKQISLHRELPEVRHPLCLQQDTNPNLPKASVIICFHDEAWSTLLRTVHSVLDTAPKGFLKEIILVDDHSKQGYLKSSLSEYISKLAGVKLIRSNKRLGVIRGRMLGAARATGDVVVFMDSHCECHRGWLEPLLDRLASDRSRIVSPVIDVIDWKMFQYYPSTDLRRGVFDWKLDFHWETLPEYEKKARQSPISPIRSPAIPGGVVAVDRHHFQNMGGYDSDMTLWGAENLELSIKAWLCGGSVEILPCSHVGHVYRTDIPYNFLDEEAVERNKIRIAETWLDSFKDLFYTQDRIAFLISQINVSLPNDGRSAVLCTLNRLRSQTVVSVFSCKRDWDANLSSGFSHMCIQNSTQFSTDQDFQARQLSNTGVGLCAEHRSQQDSAGGLIQLSPCRDSSSQHFEYNGMKEICFGSARQLCFDVRHEQVVLQNCTKGETENSPQHWDVKENGMIVHLLSGKCIEALKTALCLRTCNKEANLIWQFDHSHHIDQR